MKQKNLLVFGLILALVASGLWATSAYASTGCFSDTNGNWAETFICWLKDNGITNGTGGGNYSPDKNVTRAEMAVFLKKTFDVADTSAKAYADSLVDTPPSQGLIFINVGFSDWYVPANLTGTMYLYKYLYSTQIGHIGAGQSSILATPTLPVSLYGRNLALKGMELCYTVNNAAGYLDFVDLVVAHMNPNGSGTLGEDDISDDTNRTDSACRSYTFPTSIVLDENSSIGIQVTVQNTTNGLPLEIGRTSLIFEPTTQSTNLNP